MCEFRIHFNPTQSRIICFSFNLVRLIRLLLTLGKIPFCILRNTEREMSLLALQENKYIYYKSNKTKIIMP